jgi:superoxide dismutase, Cu-Zn family
MRSLILGLAVMTLSVGCTTNDADDTAAVGSSSGETMAGSTSTDSLIVNAPPAGVTARAVLRNPEGLEMGTATFTQSGESVRIEYQFTSLPGGEHGFHLHEVGSCEAPTFESAGGHYNPTNRSHGFDHPDGPHAGDLRNLEVDTDGTAEGDLTNEYVTLLTGRPNSLLDGDGTSIVIHAGPDDYQSQPSGDSGDRIACGEIEPT